MSAPSPGTAEYYKAQAAASKKSEEERQQQQARQQVAAEAFQREQAYAQKRALATGKTEQISTQRIQAREKALIETKYKEGVPIVTPEARAQAQKANYAAIKEQQRQQQISGPADEAIAQPSQTVGLQRSSPYRIEERTPSGQIGQVRVQGPYGVQENRPYTLEREPISEKYAQPIETRRQEAAREQKEKSQQFARGTAVYAVESAGALAALPFNFASEVLGIKEAKPVAEAIEGAAQKATEDMNRFIGYKEPKQPVSSGTGLAYAGALVGLSRITGQKPAEEKAEAMLQEQVKGAQERPVEFATATFVDILGLGGAGKGAKAAGGAKSAVKEAAEGGAETGKTIAEGAGKAKDFLGIDKGYVSATYKVKEVGPEAKLPSDVLKIPGEKKTFLAEQTKVKLETEKVKTQKDSSKKYQRETREDVVPSEGIEQPSSTGQATVLEKPTQQTKTETVQEKPKKKEKLEGMDKELAQKIAKDLELDTAKAEAFVLQEKAKQRPSIPLGKKPGVLKPTRQDIAQRQNLGEKAIKQIEAQKQQVRVKRASQEVLKIKLQSEQKPAQTQAEKLLQIRKVQQRQAQTARQGREVIQIRKPAETQKQKAEQALKIIGIPGQKTAQKRKEALKLISITTPKEKTEQVAIVIPKFRTTTVPGTLRIPVPQRPGIVIPDVVRIPDVLRIPTPDTPPPPSRPPPPPPPTKIPPPPLLKFGGGFAIGGREGLGGPTYLKKLSVKNPLLPKLSIDTKNEKKARSELLGNLTGKKGLGLSFGKKKKGKKLKFKF